MQFDNTIYRSMNGAILEEARKCNVSKEQLDEYFEIAVKKLGDDDPDILPDQLLAAAEHELLQMLSKRRQSDVLIHFCKLHHLHPVMYP